MVYPALTYLEELGYASVEVEGAKKRYRISDEGRAYFEQNRGVVDAILAQLAWVGAKMEHVRRVFAGDDLRSHDSDDAPHGWSTELRAARRALRSALGHLGEASPEEQRRAADILDRAAKEIRGEQE
jgi:DNA-binding PadR family transcriptional regulator